MRNKTYFEERCERLHFDIINNLLNRNLVKRNSDELYELLQSEYNKNNKKLSHDCILQLEDYLLLYQTLYLLRDKEKQNYCKTHIRKIFRYYKENWTSLDMVDNDAIWVQILKNWILYAKEYSKGESDLDSLKELDKAPIEKIIATSAKLYELSPRKPNKLSEKSFVIRKWLYYYTSQQNLKNESIDYDKQLDKEIVNCILAYFRHARKPKYLFYTDLQFIQERLAHDTVKESLLNNPKYKDEATANLIKVELPNPIFPMEYFDFYIDNAEKEINALKIAYTLRTLYPKPSFTASKKENYLLEQKLFNKVLFNEEYIHESSKLFAVNHYEAEILIISYLLKWKKGGEVEKSIALAIYLASKELTLAHFQDLFDDEYTSVAKKNFFTAIIYCAMWEKIHWREITCKGEHEVNNTDEMITSRFSHEYDKLFKEKNLAEIDEVLKEATKLLGMNDSGFDYSFLQKEISGYDKIALITFFLTRPETESEAQLMNLVNLISEKSNENKIIQQQDIGYLISKFHQELIPAKKYISLCSDGNYFPLAKQVFFFYSNNENTIRERAKTALDKIYIRKKRNQVAHYDLDKTIYELLKSPKDLIVFFEDAMNYYTDILTVKKQRNHINEHAEQVEYLLEVLGILKEQLECIFEEKNNDSLSLFDKKISYNKNLIENGLLKIAQILPDFNDKGQSLEVDSMTKFRELIVTLLSFLFSSDNLDYKKRHQINPFFQGQITNISYYLLYLSQFFWKI